MPCGSKAVQQSMLVANIVEEMLGSAELQEATRSWLSTALGVPVEAEMSDVWVTRGSHRRVAGDAYLRLMGGGVFVSISEKSGITLIDPEERISIDRIRTFVTALARAAVQNRLVAALGEQYRITSDSPLPNGMRTLELEV